MPSPAGKKPSCVHSRTYTGLPFTGSPLTVTARLVPCPWLYTLKLPTPVVPTDIKYCVAPAPTPQQNTVDVPSTVEPGAGLVRTSLLWFSAVSVFLPYTPLFRSPSCVHSRTYTGLPSTGSPLTVADRFVPCPWLYTLKLPTPVVPTEIKYCVAPAPTPQQKTSVVPGHVELVSRLVLKALIWFAAV